MIGLNVQARIRRQHGECRWSLSFALAPDADDYNERRVVEREAVLRFWIFLARELEKMLTPG